MFKQLFKNLLTNIDVKPFVFITINLNPAQQQEINKLNELDLFLLSIFAIFDEIFFDIKEQSEKDFNVSKDDSARKDINIQSFEKEVAKEKAKQQEEVTSKAENTVKQSSNFKPLYASQLPSFLNKSEVKTSGVANAPLYASQLPELNKQKEVKNLQNDNVGSDQAIESFEAKQSKKAVNNNQKTETTLPPTETEDNLNKGDKAMVKAALDCYADEFTKYPYWKMLLLLVNAANSKPKSEEELSSAIDDRVKYLSRR